VRKEISKKKREELLGPFCMFYYIHPQKMKLYFIHLIHTNYFMGPLQGWALASHTPGLCLWPTMIYIRIY